MGKRNNSIIISAVLVAFLAGTIFSSPNYALALPPWANDIIQSINDIVNGVTPVDLESTSTIGGQTFSTGSHTIDTNTNAGTICSSNELLDGDGNCITIAPAGADTDWTEAGGNVYRLTGNVGIRTSTPAEELEVVGNIRATPIVGQWAPNSDTSSTAVENVVFDIETVNTNAAYFGFSANTDFITIKQSGFYRVTAFVHTSGAVGGGGVAFWDILRNDSSLCNTLHVMAETSVQNACSVVGFFNANDQVKLRDKSTTASIFGSPNADITFINIERLN